MVKMNFTDSQTAFEYAMYAMLGSYYDKAVCKNKLMEKKMYVQFLEQKERNQVQMEEICIRFIEKKLMPQLPKEFWNQQVEVRFSHANEAGVRDIQFHSPEYVLCIGGLYQGKGNTQIQYEVWRKPAGHKAA